VSILVIRDGVADLGERKLALSETRVPCDWALFRSATRSPAKQT
jgi:hypothetical protein